MELELIFRRKTTTKISAIPKTLTKGTVYITMTIPVFVYMPTIIPTQLTHYKCPHLCMEPQCPYDRETSHPNLYVTKTSDIQITKTTHYEHQHLCMELGCPYDRQSSHSTLYVTKTSYIQVTKIDHVCMEQAPHRNDLPVTLLICDYIILQGQSTILPGYPKFYHGYLLPYYRC